LVASGAPSSRLLLVEEVFWQSAIRVSCLLKAQVSQAVKLKMQSLVRAEEVQISQHVALCHLKIQYRFMLSEMQCF
jgi:hypothetical protein